MRKTGDVLTNVKCFSRSSDILSGLAEETAAEAEALNKM